MGQILLDEQKVLTTVFDDDRVNGLVFTDKHKNRNSVYIYDNDLIISHINDFEKISMEMSPENTCMTLLFSTKRGDVMLFHSPDRINSITNFGIDKAIVMKNLKIKKERAMLSFVTTNFETKVRNRRPTNEKFYRIECWINFDGSQWIVERVKINDCAYKPLE